jgi:quercetin dioxygenase-like cupin family protein
MGASARLPDLRPVGCCDSSPNRHATKHFHKTRHPIIEGYDAPEGWGWCYVDEIAVDLDGRTTPQNGPIPRYVWIRICTWCVRQAWTPADATWCREQACWQLVLVVDFHSRAAFVTRAPRRFDNSCLEDGSRGELAVQISKCEGQPQEQQGDRAMIKNACKACVTTWLLSASLLLGANSVVADPAAIVKLPQDITFKGSAGGVQIAVLYGDPAKPGLYVVRLKLPGGAKVMPHTHPEEVRTLTVLSGTLYFGFGKEWDGRKLTPYPAGTFFSELPNVPHFVSAKDGEVIFQATGIGPSALIPVQQSPKWRWNPLISL